MTTEPRRKRGRPKADTSERDAVVLRLYHEGMLLKDIAKEIGLKSSGGMVRILRGLGIERPTKPQKRWRGHEDNTEKIRALWEHGLCASQITERLGCSRKMIDTALTKLGVRTGTSRHRYDNAAAGGSGSGFKANMWRRT